jgi:hypothetical protein
MDKKEILGITACVLMMLGVYFPWVNISSSLWVVDQLASLTEESISGFYFWGGVVGFIASFIGLILLIKKFRYAAVIGFVNSLTGILYLITCFGLTDAKNYPAYEYKSITGMEIAFGLYIFIIASVIYMVITFPNIKGRLWGAV